MNTKPIILLLLFYPLISFTQPTDSGALIGIVKVNGKVIEKMNAKEIALTNADVHITNIGDKKTDQNGNFSFEYPIFEGNMTEPKVAIEIRSPNYNLLHPIDGQVSLNPSEFLLSIELMVIGNDVSSAFQQQIDKQKQRINQLKKAKKLNLRQLNAINKQLLDTILYFENQQLVFQEKMQQLETKLAESSEENEVLKEELIGYKKQVETLEQSVATLSEQLFEALEAKYLRQQTYFQNISADLQEYLLNLQDINDLLPKIKLYFPSNGNRDFAPTFNQAIEKYNAIYTKIFKEHPDYLEAVDHYWKTEKLNEPTKQTFDFLIQEVHDNHFLPNLSSILDLIRQNKANKAQKQGEATHQELTLLIQQLEVKIKETISLLKNNL